MKPFRIQNRLSMPIEVTLASGDSVSIPALTWSNVIDGDELSDNIEWLHRRESIAIQEVDEEEDQTKRLSADDEPSDN